jgi:hypothetical protein
MKHSIFEKVLSSVSLDPRIENGTFSIEEDIHMEVLREYFVKKGIAESSVIEFCNKVLEGKYPERQAYNAKGILVTFPTPEYKADAIKRGTHFEDDPTKQASNVFADQPASADPKPATAPQPKADTKTSLPVSQAATPAAEPAGPATPDAAPPPAETPTAATTAAPQQSTEPEEPPIEPTELPPPEQKSQAEKEADKNLIKNMLKGDDYMLEQICEWVAYSGPAYLIEQLKKYKKS